MDLKILVDNKKDSPPMNDLWDGNFLPKLDFLFF